MADDNGKGVTPAAYLPFKTFLSAIEVLEHRMPRRLDRTVWRSQSGIVQSQIMMAFRFFGLVNETDEPTAALHRLVENKERRKEHVGALLQHSYRALMELDLTKMSPKMLEDAMGQYNVTGDTRRKAITFFLRAARFADLPMHPLLTAQTRETGNGARKKRAKTAKPQEPQGGDGAAVQSQNGSQSAPAASRKTISLLSGGAVTLEIAANPFLMSPTDRSFVFELIDTLHKYETDHPSVEDEEGEEEDQ